MCPSCDWPMQSKGVALDDQTAVVDVCERCHGAFFEFFDGEPSALARQLSTNVEPVASSRTKIGPCPDCKVEMVYARYQEHGPTVARCGSCLGLFATQSQLTELAHYAQLEAPRRSFVEQVLEFVRGRAE
jgi:Zn-finger nucleic acid-binding protein